MWTHSQNPLSLLSLLLPSQKCISNNMLIPLFPFHGKVESTNHIIKCFIQSSGKRLGKRKIRFAFQYIMCGILS